MALSDLNNDSNEIGKYANDGTGDQYEYQNSGDSFFKVCVLTKKMSCVEKKAYKENDSQNDRENGSDGAGNIIDRIFNATNLSKNGCGKKR